MENNKLISMTDFVLNEKDNFPISVHEFADRVCSYATFLKQPLTLSMFVPTDEEGNVLEEPIEDDLCSSFFEKQKSFHEEKEYSEAKSKVLFKGVSKAQYNWFLKIYSSVEELTHISNSITPIQLTETAIKQIYR